VGNRTIGADEEKTEKKQTKTGENGFSFVSLCFTFHSVGWKSPFFQLAAWRQISQKRNFL
jgi:hypothetical protein